MRARFPKKTYQRILKKQKMLCACGCGVKLEKGAIDFDHIVPLHLGGADSPDNLRALRLECHKIKTVTESKVRAKIRRIKESDGLTKKRLNKKEKMVRRMKRRNLMP